MQPIPDRRSIDWPHDSTAADALCPAWWKFQLFDLPSMTTA
jgi:hypothetical protein